MWKIIPAELAKKLASFRKPGNIIRGATNSSHLADAYNALPPHIQRLLPSLGRPGFVMLRFNPTAFQAVPEPLRQMYIDFAPTLDMMPNQDFNWNAFSAEEQMGLQENIAIGQFMQNFKTDVWNALPPRVRILVTSNIRSWEEFFDQPVPPVWKELPERYLELSAAHGQTTIPIKSSH